MTSQMRKTRSSRRSRANAKYRSWILGFMVLAFAAMILAGPQTVCPKYGGTRRTGRVRCQLPARTRKTAPRHDHHHAGCRHANAGNSAAAHATPTGDGHATRSAMTTAPATQHLPRCHCLRRRHRRCRARPEAKAAEAVKLPFGNQPHGRHCLSCSIAAFVALAFGWLLVEENPRADPGNERMQGVAAAVQEGAMAYLCRQVKTMIPLVIIIAAGAVIPVSSTIHSSWLLGRRAWPSPSSSA